MNLRKRVESDLSCRSTNSGKTMLLHKCSVEYHLGQLSRCILKLGNPSRERLHGCLK